MEAIASRLEAIALCSFSALPFFLDHRPWSRMMRHHHLQSRQQPLQQSRRRKTSRATGNKTNKRHTLQDRHLVFCHTCSQSFLVPRGLLALTLVPPAPVKMGYTILRHLCCSSRFPHERHVSSRASADS